MYDRAKKIAQEIKKYDDIKIVSHIDADGIAAASIASIALERSGIVHRVEFVKQLDGFVIDSLKDENPGLLWFTDLGSGSLGQLGGLDMVITDHHVPSQGVAVPLRDRRDLFTFFNALRKSFLHLNPHFFGRDGAIDISGAGVTYLVARALSKGNMDLSALAVVGAVGDLQDSVNRRLVGENRGILEDGGRAGVLSWHMDIQLFGRETRPVFRLLQYASDPMLPRLTGDEENCIRFLEEVGISLKDNGKWRKWVDLTGEEKRKILSEIVILLLEKGFDHNIAKRILGEVYILQKEEGMLRDAKEFATLLNSCGRYDEAMVGYKVCLGDRKEFLVRAQRLLQGHRKTLVDALRIVRDSGVKETGYIQYFHGGDKILDSVIGVTASMMLGSGEIDKNLPFFVFADSRNGIKVSARSTREIVSKGLDLSIVMRKASKEVGGEGGGHNVAAGATIPRGSEEEFLENVEEIVKRQLRG